MRPCRNAEFVLTPAGEVSGLFLPGGYCAEHEQGIDPMLRALGVDPDVRAEVIGVDRYRLPAPLPEGAMFFQHWLTPRRKHVKQFALLSLGWSHFSQDPADRAREYAATRGLAHHAEWGDHELCAYFTGDDAPRLELIAEALRTGDACLYMGGGSGNPFARGGIVIGVVSKMPEADLRQLAETHADELALQRAVDQTGIVARLEATRKPGSWASRDLNGCYWFALKPAWTGTVKTASLPGAREGSREIKTTHPVIFFLNPQGDCNFGWVTVEDLEDWIADRGVIPMRVRPQ